MARDYELQKAIYSTLLADATLAALVDGIYDDVEDAPGADADSGYPFIVVGDDQFSPSPTDDATGMSAIIQVHVFSRYDGYKEAKQIMGAVNDVLDRNTGFTVTGFKVIDCGFDYSAVDTIDDGKLRHGLIRFRVTAREV